MTNQAAYFWRALTALFVLFFVLGVISRGDCQHPQPPANTVLLDFYGSQCPPCRAMRPVIEQLKQAGYPVRSINVNEEPIMAQKYGITNIPCFIMVSDGRVVSRTVGMTSANNLASICQQGINDAYASQYKAASARVNAGANNSANNSVNNNNFSGTRFASSVPVETIPASSRKKLESERPASIAPSANLLSPERLLASTVRIRVKTSVCDHGAGTIIDSRNDRALILTCGHLFREYAKENGGKIEVDMFGKYPLQNVPAKYICHDEESDLGLICISISNPVTIIPVAPLNYQALRGSACASAGCDNGRAPTVQQSQIVAINKCLGPANLYASGASVQGRSGGGLFSKDGYLIGVTLANIPGENQSLYSSYPAIHQLLNQHRLAAVITFPKNDSIKLAKNDAVYMPKTMPKPQTPVQLTTATTDRVQGVITNTSTSFTTPALEPELNVVSNSTERSVTPTTNNDVYANNVGANNAPVNNGVNNNGVNNNDINNNDEGLIPVVPQRTQAKPFKVRPDFPAWPPRFPD